MKVPRPSTNRLPSWAPAALAAALAVAAWAAHGWTGAGGDPDRVWSEAQADLRGGRIGPATAAVARLRRLREPTPADHLLEGQTEVAAGRTDAAVAALARVPDGHPLAPQARLLAGQVELRRKRIRAAERLLREAVRLDPGLAQGHRELIYIYGMLLRRRELYAEFLALSRAAPLTFDNAFHWCLTRNAVWEAKEITGVLRSYLAADPGDRWSRLALAENLRQVDRPDDAEAALDPLPASDPDARAIRVRLALDRGDDEGASALLAEGPADHPELARLRGRSALARRDGPAAVRHFRAAHAAEPDDRDTLFGLGQALAMAGDPAAAAPYLAAARDLDAVGSLLQRAANKTGTRDRALLLALGAACEKAGRLPEARAWFNLAIESDPLDPVAQKALFRLKDRPPAR